MEDTLLVRMVFPLLGTGLGVLHTDPSPESPEEGQGAGAFSCAQSAQATGESLVGVKRGPGTREMTLTAVWVSTGSQYLDRIKAEQDHFWE